ncbi:nuclear transport factor 2 family protein [Dietzia sp. B32]|uniref:nuclear transport factor 2 family protein n=1 Tax=Dietzia sp. B32 TaxID=2915130 RepID=UPI0021ADF5DA|nr:nuclear transport factor 2 family protein [Dietzia sp. B32]UVE94192.1 hypothetical protein L8M95_11590 [Dietzia sp. B32]
MGGELAELLGAWWFHYDEWDEKRLRGLVTDDVRFTCRTDSGTTDYEEFVRVDAVGVDEVMAWQRDHRRGSPYPLRHNGSNVHVTATTGGVVEFASYIFVTKTVDGRPLALSSGTASGKVVRTEVGWRIAQLDIVLDTTDSQQYGDLVADDQLESRA